MERRLDHEQLSNALFALRADRLFAVTLAGDAEAVEAVLAEAKREAVRPRAAAKALGDATADLTYTPLNPCRILDTRATAAGPLAPNVTRTFDGYSTNFAEQGGTTSGCGIPNGVAALAMNVYAVNPTNLGFIKVWPANGAEPDVSTVNYQPGITAIATGTLVPVDQASSNRFTAKSPAAVDFVADAVGYFRVPANLFAQGGNAFGATGSLGTLDQHALELRVNNGVAFRLVPGNFIGNTGIVNVIGGSAANVADNAFGATIAGGGCATQSAECLPGAANVASGSWFGTVGGGAKNVAAGSAPVVAGGMGNSAGDFAVVAGGGFNSATGGMSGVLGGNQNSASGGYATVGAGYKNSASGSFAVIGGGSENVADGPGTAIAGGASNRGSGENSFVAGGAWNTASGRGSFAGGIRAKTQTPGPSPTAHSGTFVFADDSNESVEFNSVAANEFAIRSTGGVRFVTAIDGTGTPTWTCGVSGGAGGSWGCTSDRAAKSDLLPLDGIATLERLATLPVYRWVAKDDPRRTPHAGPTAQDFMATFGLGDNDRMIGFADAQGVAFAAIQGLNSKFEERLAERDARILRQEQEIAALKRAVEMLLLRASPDGRVDKR
jgi:hypothetical protein